MQTSVPHSKRVRSLPSHLSRAPVLDSAKRASARARGIIALYGDALERERSAGSEIGGRRLKRKITPPRNRAINFLRREIYRCAVELTDPTKMKKCQDYVNSRDNRRYSTGLYPEVNWSIRLVVYQRPLPANFDVLRSIYHDVDAGALLNPTATSRLTTELRYVWGYGVRWQLVDMLIEHLGGYELMSAANQAEEHLWRTEDWAKYLADPRLRNFDEDEEYEGWPDE